MTINFDEWKLPVARWNADTLRAWSRLNRYPLWHKYLVLEQGISGANTEGKMSHHIPQSRAMLADPDLPPPDEGVWPWAAWVREDWVFAGVREGWGWSATEDRDLSWIARQEGKLSSYGGPYCVPEVKDFLADYHAGKLPTPDLGVCNWGPYAPASKNQGQGVGKPKPQPLKRLVVEKEFSWAGLGYGELRRLAQAETLQAARKLMMFEREYPICKCCGRLGVWVLEEFLRPVSGILQLQVSLVCPDLAQEPRT